MSKEIVKYLLVGGINTAITLLVIFLLLYLGIGLYLSNIIGYIIGVGFSFIANTLFTFSTSLSFFRLIKFLLVCLACWCGNFLAIKTYLSFEPQAIYESQLFGMFFYTSLGFFINKFWSMK